MASGKTHDRVTLLLLPVVGWAALAGLHWHWWPCVLLITGTWAGGLLLSPDLDTRSRPYYRWGVFRFIWRPYQWLTGHRSALSHGLWLAPWLRLLYLSAVLIALYAGVSLWLKQIVGQPADLHAPRQAVIAFWHHYKDNVLIFGAGVWLGSLIHLVLDALTDTWNALWRTRRR